MNFGRFVIQTLQSRNVLYPVATCLWSFIPFSILLHCCHFHTHIALLGYKYKCIIYRFQRYTNTPYVFVFEYILAIGHLLPQKWNCHFGQRQEIFSTTPRYTTTAHWNSHEHNVSSSNLCITFLPSLYDSHQCECVCAYWSSCCSAWTNTHSIY